MVGRRSSRHGHLLAQGVHPADPAVPRPLPLLHLRHRAAPGSGGRTCRRTRSSRSPGRAQRRAARRRCSPWVTGRRTAGRPPASGWTRTGTTTRSPTCGPWRSGCSRRPGCCRTSTPGSCRWSELQRLKPVAPSMGMMLETTSHAAVHRARAGPLRLARQGPGGPAARARGRRPGRRPVHDRHPRRHRRDAAGAADSSSRSAASPGSTARCRSASCRTSAPRTDTAMRGTPDLGAGGVPRHDRRHPAAAGPVGARCRRRPTSSTRNRSRALLAAGVDDWGGVSPVTPDHVNPERPWPEVEDLRRWTAESGLRADRAAHRPPARTSSARWSGTRRGSTRGCTRTCGPSWTPPPVWPARTPGRSACRGRSPTAGWPRRVRHRSVDLHRGVDEEGRSADRRSDFDEVYGDWQEVRRTRRGAGRAARSTPTSGPRWAGAQDDPAGLSDDDYLALLTADGADLDARGRARRRAAAGRGRRRRDLRREPQHQLHQRLLRRLPLLRVRPAQDRRRRLHALARRGRRTAPRRRRSSGATEVCMQGGIYPGPARHGVRRHRARGEGRGARDARACLLARWRSSTASATGRHVDRGRG